MGSTSGKLLGTLDCSRSQHPSSGFRSEGLQFLNGRALIGKGLLFETNDFVHSSSASAVKPHPRDLCDRKRGIFLYTLNIATGHHIRSREYS
jgi:hypothetical protein